MRYEIDTWIYVGKCILCHYEHVWLSNCSGPLKTFYYRRFVDDTFLLFKYFTHVLKFLSFLNLQHFDIVSKKKRTENYFFDYVHSPLEQQLWHFSVQKPTFIPLTYLCMQHLLKLDNA